MDTNPRPSPIKKILKINRIFLYIEDGLLVSALSVMLLLSFGQIVLRLFAQVGLPWANALLGYLVLWVGLLGAMVATRDDNHISIDILSHLLSARGKAVLRIFTDAFTSAACAYLTYASIDFLLNVEMGSGDNAFAHVPTWAAELILPVAFAAISIRYIIYLVIHLVHAIKGVPDQTERFDPFDKLRPGRLTPGSEGEP